MQPPGHVEAARRAVTVHMPGYPIRSVTLMGQGLDNTAYEVNAELVVRFSNRPDGRARARAVRREAGVLEVVHPASTLPTPHLRFVSEEQGCLAYFKLAGVPLLDRPEPLRAARAVGIADALGRFLRSVQSIPPDVVVTIADVDHLPLLAWRDEARSIFETISAQLPGPHHRPIRTFLDRPPPPDGDRLAFSHNDLGIEHVLVDDAAMTVTGVIDWTDAAIVDPAHDLGRVLRDLGPVALGAALRSYGVEEADDAGLVERAWFYARCSVLEDLAHGVETRDRRYVDKNLRSMGWLFPPAMLAP